MQQNYSNLTTIKMKTIKNVIKSSNQYRQTKNHIQNKSLYLYICVYIHAFIYFRKICCLYIEYIYL